MKQSTFDTILMIAIAITIIIAALTLAEVIPAFFLYIDIVLFILGEAYLIYENYDKNSLL